MMSSTCSGPLRVRSVLNEMLSRYEGSLTPGVDIQLFGGWSNSQRSLSRTGGLRRACRSCPLPALSVHLKLGPVLEVSRICAVAWPQARELRPQYQAGITSVPVSVSIRLTLWPPGTQKLMHYGVYYRCDRTISPVIAVSLDAYLVPNVLRNTLASTTPRGFNASTIYNCTFKSNCA